LKNSLNKIELKMLLASRVPTWMKAALSLVIN